MHYPDGRKGKTNFKIEAEDFIAIGGVLIALMFGVAMIFGVVPINKLTVAIVGLSGVGAVVPSIVKARHRKESGSRWLERAIWILSLAVLAAAFAMYAWLRR